jgi:hypothetical protein
MSDIAIRVENLSKQYHTIETHREVKELATNYTN